MDPLSSILRNSSLLAAAQAVSSLIGMALVVLLPRFLGDAEFGRLHLALSLTGMFSVAVQFGLTSVVARAVARQRTLARPYFRSATALITALGAVTYVVLLALVRILGYPVHIHELAAILGIVMVADALSETLSALFLAHERMLVPAAARIVGNAFTLAVAVPLLAHGYGARAVATVMVTAAGLRLMIQAASLRRLDGFRGTDAPPAGSWRELLAAGFPFLVWEALGILYFRIDVLMLGLMTTDATVGWYGAASRLLDALGFVPHILTVATFPVAARLWVTAPDEFRAIVRKALQLMLVVTVPVAVLLLTLARDIVGFLFTLESFGPSVPILRIHALTLAVLFINFFLVGVLMAIGRERAWIAVAGLACLLNPAMNLVLIPLTDARFANGGIGAAIATLLTELFVLACAVALYPAGTLGRASWRIAAQAAGSGALMGALVLGSRALDLPWMLAAVVGGLGYLLAVVRLGIVPEAVTGLVRRGAARRSPAELVS